MGYENAPVNRHSVFGGIVGAPVVWGGAATAVFYAVVPILPFGREQLTRYFCSHPLEYALVGLFFVGLAILTRRVLLLRAERQALREAVLPLPEPDADAATLVMALERQLDASPASLRHSMLHQRLRGTCTYLRGSASVKTLETHLKHLSETAADRLQDSYSLLLTINWAVPIIGFLGTVIGITLAIANVTPEQLDTSLNSVTGGLAIAFDTTTVAMSFSLVLVFAYDWVKRSEQRILAAVDDIMLREVLTYFADGTTEHNPLMEAQSYAAQQLVEQTESLVREQTTLWRDSVDGLRERWSETIVDQQQHLASGLTSGVESTLADHAQQLQLARQEFATAFDTMTEQFSAAFESNHRHQAQRDLATQQSLETLWQRVSEELTAAIDSQNTRTGEIVKGFNENLQLWQNGLSQTMQVMESQLKQIQDLSEIMLRLAGQEEQLVVVERQLSENLAAVHAAETFEQTLHNLTAAVHLLTARAKPRAA